MSLSPQPIRVRIAPSPTGDPHVGTAYVTLFNYIFAKQNNGQLILRIEDTDRTRYRKESEDKILTSLKWLGLEWDEGPDVSGPYGPYRQSERLPIYQQYIKKLIDRSKAYYCFCTSTTLDEMRKEQKAKGLPYGYDRRCRHLEKSIIEKNLENKIPHVIRLKVPSTGTKEFTDVLRGKIRIDFEQIDDQILLKSDGFPTYHLANVVDDFLMKISHVIRAEEWISSTPKHVLLYEAFGWELPKFIHLPLLRNSDRSKISKRKNPVCLDYYKRKGILAKTIINFLALMGWSYSDSQEVFSIEDMKEKFKLEDIHLGGPVFDQKKLLWLNQQYIQKMSSSTFVNFMQKELISSKYLEKLHPLVIERFEAFEQFFDKFSFFFNGSIDYSMLEVIPKSKTKEEFQKMLKELIVYFESIDVWDSHEIDKIMHIHLKETNWKPREYFMPIRLITTGRKDSPPLVETLATLGRDIVRFRIANFIDEIKKKL